MHLPDGVDELQESDSFNSDPSVEFAEVDALIPPDDILPNDPGFGSQWGLSKISSPQAWGLVTGSNSIVIAILDTGVEATHPDLAPNLITGWNVINSNTDTSPVNYHGTMVAGVAAASGNNGTSITGTCWNCKIMPIRITNQSSGYANWSDIANGVLYAADHGAKVVNNSYQSWQSSTVASAGKYLQGKGGVLVTSAGNDGLTYTNAMSPYVLVVGGSDSNDGIYSWSSRGSMVGIAAPGNVYTTNLGGGYIGGEVTSFASPMTAGVIGLMFSINPGLTPSQIISILESSAIDFGSAGYDINYGYGRLNAAGAVSLAQTTTGTPTDGSCGSSSGKYFNTIPTANLCASGTSTAVNLSGSNLSWTCQGTNGGLSPACFATYDVTAPTAPSGLTASEVVTSTKKGKTVKTVISVKLAWTASTDDIFVSYYQIYKNGVLFSTSTTLNFSDSSVAVGSTYTNRI